MKARVCIYQTRIPKYRESFFMTLFALGEKDEIEYKIVVSDDRLKIFRHESSMENGVLGVRIKRIKIFGREFHIHQKLDLHKYANLVICEYGLKNFLVYYLLFFNKPIKFAFWGHGHTTTRPTWKIENALQAWLLTRADFFFAYTQSCADKIASLGFRSDRITNVNNSVDTNSLRKLDRRGLGREALKNFGLSSSNETFLYIGSLEADKRLDFLLDAFEELVKINPNVNLIICSQDSIQSATSRILPTGAHFFGEADLEMKRELARDCKAILNPGRVGLIAVDSFALGIPIVTTNWNRHAPEFSYLENGVNSLITENNLLSFVEGCIKVLDNSPFRTKLISGCIDSSEKYTVEKMAANFHLGVMKCLEI